MQVLMKMGWNLPPERTEEYSEFVKNRFIPGCTELGLQPVGGFYVEVGAGPILMSVNRADSLEDLNRIMASVEYEQLVADLKDIVVGYRSKIMRSTGRVPRGTYQIQKGVWKFNQYWDIQPGKRAEYAQFILQEYHPALEALDYLEVTDAWQVLIGGHSEIVLELTFRDPVDIGALFDNPTYRENSYRLKTEYVTNYYSRILRTTEYFAEPRWFAL